MKHSHYSKLLFWLVFIQAIYYLLTGLWPLIHIRSFIWVTGPKYDVWLVKTVGILLLVIGGVMLSAAIRKRISLEIGLLAITSALGLTFIDIYYVAIDRIWPVYLLDALAEILLILGWMIAWWKAKPA
jgi:hypothetical protein